MAIDFSISSFMSGFTPATLGSYALGGDREGDDGDRDRYIGAAVTGGFVGLGLLGMAWRGKKKGAGTGPGGPKGPDGPFGEDPKKKSVSERLAIARKLKLAAMQDNAAAKKLAGDEQRAKLSEVHATCVEIKRWVVKKVRRGKVIAIKGGEPYVQFADGQLAKLESQGITSPKPDDPFARAGKKHAATGGEPPPDWRDDPRRPDPFASRYSQAAWERNRAQEALATAQQQLAEVTAERDAALVDLAGEQGENLALGIRSGELTEQLRVAREQHDQLSDENVRLAAAASASPDAAAELARVRRDLVAAQGRIAELELLEGDLHGRIDELATMVDEQRGVRAENIRLQTENMTLEVVRGRNAELVEENRGLEQLNQDLRLENERRIQQVRELTEASGEGGEAIANLQGRVTELEATETSLREEVGAQTTTIDELNEANRQLTQRLEVRNASGASLQGKLSTLQGEHTALQRTHEQLQGEHTALDQRHQELTEQHEQLTRRYGEAMVSASHAGEDRNAALKRVAALEAQLGVRAEESSSPPPLPGARGGQPDIPRNRTLADREIRVPASDLEPAGFDDPVVQAHTVELFDEAHDRAGSADRLPWYFATLGTELIRQGIPGFTNELALALYGLTAEGELTPEMVEWVTALLRGDHPRFFDLLSRAHHFENRVRGTTRPGNVVAGLMRLWMHDQSAATAADLKPQEGTDGYSDAYTSHVDSATQLPPELVSGLEGRAASDPAGLLGEAQLYMRALRQFESDRERFAQGGQPLHAQLIGMMQMNTAWYIRRAAESIAHASDETVPGVESLMQFARTQGALTDEELSALQLSVINDVDHVRANSTLHDIHRSRYRHVLAMAGAGDPDGNKTRVAAQELGIGRNFDNYIGKRWGVSIGGQDWALRQPEDHIGFLFERDRAENEAFSHLLCSIGRSMFEHDTSDHDETRMYDGLARFMDDINPDIDARGQTVARLREFIGAEKTFTAEGYVNTEKFAGTGPTDDEAVDIIGRIGLLADTFTGEDYDYCQRNTMAFALCLLAVDRSGLSRPELNYILTDAPPIRTQLFERLTGHIRDVANKLMIGNDAWSSALALLEEVANGGDTSPPSSSPNTTQGPLPVPPLPEIPGGGVSGAALYGANWRGDFGAMMMGARPYRYVPHSSRYARGWNAGFVRRGGMNTFRPLQRAAFM